jgi:hypothetical protein
MKAIKEGKAKEKKLDDFDTAEKKKKKRQKNNIKKTPLPTTNLQSDKTEMAIDAATRQNL